MTRGPQSQARTGAIQGVLGPEDTLLLRREDGFNVRVSTVAVGSKRGGPNLPAFFAITLPRSLAEQLHTELGHALDNDDRNEVTTIPGADEGEW